MCIPVRSMLYQLAPFGMGTRLVEGLSGYLNRLATAHALSTLDLVQLDLFPLDVSDAEDRNERRAIFCRSGYLMDGSELHTRSWVDAIERATMQVGLKALTLEPYTMIFNNSWLRRKRAWCVQCLDSWKEKGQEPYEPLIWSTRVCHACPDHRIRLEDTCRQCGGSWRPLSGRSKCGWCAWCQCWLGGSPRKQETSGVDPFELWCSYQVGDLVLKMNSVPEHLDRDTVSHAMKTYLESGIYKNIETMAHFTGCTRSAIGWWTEGKIRPRVESFFRLCYELNNPVPILLFPRAHSSQSAQEAFHWRDEHDQPRPIQSSRLRPGRPKGAPSSTVFQAKDPSPLKSLYLKRALVLAAATSPCIPPGELAKQLGYSSAREIQRKYPVHYAALNQRYKIQLQAIQGQIRRRLLDAMSESPPPTLASIAKEFKKSSSTPIRTLEPILCEQLLAKREKRKSEKLKENGRLIEAAIRAGVKIPFHKFCRKSKLCPESISTYLPEHKRWYELQYRDFTSANRSQRYKVNAKEIADAVVELQRNGLYPTRTNILKLIPAIKRIGWRELHAGIEGVLARQMPKQAADLSYADLRD
jgi:hypothetical protein